MGVKLTCDSWMIMPDLELLLGENSNIVKFQKLFTIENIDRDATWYMGWIFPGYYMEIDRIQMSDIIDIRDKMRRLCIRLRRNIR